MTTPCADAAAARPAECAWANIEHGSVIRLCFVAAESPLYLAWDHVENKMVTTRDREDPYAKFSMVRHSASMVSLAVDTLAQYQGDHGVTHLDPDTGPFVSPKNDDAGDADDKKTWCCRGPKVDSWEQLLLEDRGNGQVVISTNDASTLQKEYMSPRNLEDGQPVIRRAVARK